MLIWKISLILQQEQRIQKGKNEEKNKEFFF
jgi:hypothetical protein